MRIQISETQILDEIICERNGKLRVSEKEVYLERIVTPFSIDIEASSEKFVSPREIIGEAIIDYVDGEDMSEFNGFITWAIGRQVRSEGFISNNDYVPEEVKYAVALQFCRYRILR